MMPWAYQEGLTTFVGETDTYEQMQENLYNETIEVTQNIDISAAPVGWTWYNTILSENELDLYLSDNHQTRSGAYLTACVFYSTIFLEPAPLIQYDWEGDEYQEYFHDVSYSTVINHLDLWNIY